MTVYTLATRYTVYTVKPQSFAERLFGKHNRGILYIRPTTIRYVYNVRTCIRRTYIITVYIVQAQVFARESNVSLTFLRRVLFIGTKYYRYDNIHSYNKQSNAFGN